MFEHTSEPGAIAAFDQAQAGAIDTLSSADAFLVIVQDRKGALVVSAGVLGPVAPKFLSAAASEATSLARQAMEELWSLLTTSTDEDEGGE